jgi:hypothetical protein
MDVWIECWHCEDGYSGHDCGEDTCGCLDPEDNEPCPICHGNEGWWTSERVHEEREERDV